MSWYSQEEYLRIVKERENERKQKELEERIFYWTGFNFPMKIKKAVDVMRNGFKGYCEGQERIVEDILKRNFWEKNLILTGKQGTGKTLILGYLLKKAIIEHGVGGHYITTHEIFITIKADFENELKMYKKLKDTGILVLDEIDLYNQDDKNWLFLNSLLCRRHDDGLPTWLASNSSVFELENILGSRVIKRLLCEGEVFELNFESFRDKLIIKERGG